MADINTVSIIESNCPNSIVSSSTLQKLIDNQLITVRSATVNDEKGYPHQGRRFIVNYDLIPCEIKANIERSDLNNKESLIVWWW